MRGISLLGSLAVAALMLVLAPAAHALQTEVGSKKTLADGVTQQITYKVPLGTVSSGQNKIRNVSVPGSGKPAVDGWITSFKPDLVISDGYPGAGTIPSSAKVMFHHGVFINTSRGFQQFFATGEEKTQMILPDGYGYRNLGSDSWLLNEMIHNLTPAVMHLTATYTVEFIPDTAPEAAAIKPAVPIWMDVENGQNRGYPVFDVLRDSGGADGEFSYPKDDPNAYSPGVHLNRWKAGQDGVLLGTTGHVHTGGLSTVLSMTRPGAKYTGPTCNEPVGHDAEYAALTATIDGNTATSAKVTAKAKLKTKAIKKLKKSMKPRKMKRLRKSMKPRKFKRWKRKKKKRLKLLKKVNSARYAKLRKLKASTSDATDGRQQLEEKAATEKKTYDACTANTPTVNGDQVRLFESTAHYFEPAGPVSWDMAMVSTKDDWRVQVKKNDVLDLEAVYETKIGSWYESMGINVVFWSPGEENGRNPYETKVDTPGVLNHGHYPENDDHGGTTPDVGPDPRNLGDGLLASDGPFDVGGPGYSYSYEAGGFNLPGANGKPPVVEQGQSIEFQLTSADATKEIWHSLTSCAAPCNKSTGIAYPLPDGEFQFDSGQLGNLQGNGAPPTVGKTTWETPPNIPVGTHTFFCRIHPLMRGSFRVKPKT